MPLPSLAPDSGENAAARGRQSQLRGMEAHGRNQIPQLIQGEDGMLYLAWRSSIHEADDFPYPNTTPQFSLPGLLDDDATTEASNATLLRKIESSVSDYGIQGTTDVTGKSLLLRANPVAIRPVHDFQVIWLGRQRKWHVASGVLTWRAMLPNGESYPVSRFYPASRFDGVEGWLTIHIGVHPEKGSDENEEGGLNQGYRLTAPFSLSMNWQPEQRPPLLSASYHGTIGDPDNMPYTEHTWSSGMLHLPIAWASPPSDSNPAPIIHQVATGGYLIPEARWFGSLPSPVFIPWRTTF